MAKNVKPDELVDEIYATIAQYIKDVRDEIDKTTEIVGKETKVRVKEKSPYRHGDYRKAISVRFDKQVLGNKKATIYVKKPHYRLTHLLEHGHALRNGGRSRAFPHWQQAEQDAIRDYEKGVIEAIQTGGKS